MLLIILVGPYSRGSNYPEGWLKLQVPNPTDADLVGLG